MFCNSKYTTWYNDIIEKAKRQQRKKGEGIYYEKHHIVPKSMGGTNNKNNLVLLTAREHFMCHLLLPKMCIDSDHKRKMVYAYMCISEMGNKFNRHHIYKSKIYEAYKQKYVPLISGENCYMYGVSKSEEIKKKISETRIKEGTGRGENNPMYNKQHTTESKKRMSKTSKGLMTEEKRIQMVQANPRSKQVQTEDGSVFISLSEAGRYYGFIGLTAPRGRIKKGIWKYLD